MIMNGWLNLIAKNINDYSIPGGFYFFKCNAWWSVFIDRHIDDSTYKKNIYSYDNYFVQVVEQSNN